MKSRFKMRTGGGTPECSVVTLCVATITALTAVAFVGIAFRFVFSNQDKFIYNMNDDD